MAGMEPPSLMYRGLVRGFLADSGGRGRDVASLVTSVNAEVLGPPLASTEDVVGEGLEICVFCTSSFFGMVSLSAFSLLTARDDFLRC